MNRRVARREVATGENMRRILRDEGNDNCVILPSARGPSTTWCKLPTPRVDNNDCLAETLRRRAKLLESIRERLSAVSDNSDMQNLRSTISVLRATATAKSGCKRCCSRTCWSTMRDWVDFHCSDERVLTVAVKYDNLASGFGRNQTLCDVHANQSQEVYILHFFFIGLDPRLELALELETIWTRNIRERTLSL
jgi:hypothetical protein